MRIIEFYFNEVCNEHKRPGYKEENIKVGIQPDGEFADIVDLEHISVPQHLGQVNSSKQFIAHWEKVNYLAKQLGANTKHHTNTQFNILIYGKDVHTK